MSEVEEEKPKRPEADSQEKPPKTPAPQLTEEQINAPSKQTLVMLSVICASTLIMWAAGRAACNYRVPGESLTARPTTIEQRTRTSKDVGIELAQTVSSGDFEAALSLSTGDAAVWVKKEKAECGACLSRKAARKNIISVGTVLEANSIDSVVKVRTTGAPGGELVRFMGIERQGRKWRVSRIYQDAASAELKPMPARNTAPAAIRRVEESPLLAKEPAPATPKPAPSTPVSPKPASPKSSPSTPAPKAPSAP